MGTRDAIAFLKRRKAPYFWNRHTHTITLGTAKTSAGGHPPIWVLEEPVFVARGSGRLWDVWRDYGAAGRVLIGTFVRVEEAVKFAVILVDAACLRDARSRPRIQNLDAH